MLFLTSAAASAVDPAGRSYRLAPGDVIEVEVWREPDLSGRYTIDPGGSLPHVLAGAIAAEGATPLELAGRLRAVLERDYLREARVSVALVESARAQASVLGAVAKPGLYPIRSHTRLLELISAAGGTTAEAEGTATVLRDGPAPVHDREGGPVRQRLTIDLAGLLRRGELSQNPLLRPGDVVVVAARESQVAAAPPGGRVRVVGEVKRPGSYALHEAGTALDALLAAGGLTDFASANRARVVRGEGEGREEIRVRLKDVMEGRKGAGDLELREGDMLVVPESFF